MMNRIKVKPEYAELLEERFLTRAGLVDGMPAFTHNEVLRPAQDGKPYTVLAYWQSNEDSEGWTTSDELKESHLRKGALPCEAFDGSSEIEKREVFLQSVLQQVGEGGAS